MTRIVDAAFGRIRVVLTILFVLLAFGTASYLSLPREGDPDVPIPFVLVSVVLPGISPEDGERLIARPAELELQAIEGIKQMDTFTYEGAVQILIEFEITFDADQALIDVREAVDTAKTYFPEDAEEPVVQEFNAQTAFPTVSVVLYGDAPERAIYQAARRLKDKIESLGGVLEANLTGDREELLEVLVDPAILETYRVTEQELVTAILNNNRLVAAGNIDTGDGRFAVKVPGLVKSAEDVFNIPVKASGDGVVTIGDLASVRRTFKDPDGFARYNGAPSIGLDVIKRTGSNIVDTVAEVRAIVEAESERWPSTIQYSMIRDQSEYTESQLSTLTSSIITAILLVMIVVVAALGLRSAIMVGLAIPSSFIIGFLLLSVSGLTLNMMVMFAMVLAVGLLVDSAIIIVEYADRRISENIPRRDAYLEAAKRMFWPVVSSTGTTLAAFIPFLFWNSMPGEYMKFLPITLIYVLTASLCVALIFLPVIGSLIGPRRKHLQQQEALDAIDPRSAPGVTGAYARFIDGLIKRPIAAIAAAVFTVFGINVAYTIADPDAEFFIRLDPEEVFVVVMGRGNLSAHERLDILLDVERRLHGVEGVEAVFTNVGGAGAQAAGDLPVDTIGTIALDLLPYNERRSGREILDEIRSRVRGVAGVKIEVREPQQGPPIGKDVQLELSGIDYDAMLVATAKARAFLEDARTEVDGRDIHAFIDIEDTSPLPGIDWELDVDREQAGKFGASVQSVGAVVQLVTNGLLVDRYRPDDAEDEVDIRVRFPEHARGISAIDNLRVLTPRGPVPMTNFVTREPRPQVDRVTRRDGARIMELLANANDADPNYVVGQDKATDILREWLETDPLSAAVDWRLRGAEEENAEAAQFFAGAMAAALFMMAVILLTQFNNFYHSLLTLSAVILSFFGVMLGIVVTGQYVSYIMTGTGVVALAGIVVNNNIVLIDTYQHVLRSGYSVEEAVVRTAAQRMRPVMLTTITTICGLLPMVFQLNVNFAGGHIGQGSQSSEWWVLLSTAVVAGLAFSTVLTLVLTPVMLAAPTVIWRRATAPWRWAVAQWRNRFSRGGVPDAAPAE